MCCCFLILLKEVRKGEYGNLSVLIGIFERILINCVMIIKILLFFACLLRNYRSKGKEK